MPDYVLRRLGQALNDRHRSVRGSRVLLLGLAYKANTGDAREAPGRPGGQAPPSDGRRGARRGPARRR
ncbi:hypothetical protein [Streptomyces sp. NPDC058424]|uniref:hypothetical protein n=1 Tax=Streptomyces sp. NPDC058424 TaxID=3346491 RepID=UPI00364C5E84